jgi:hypothetical protein
MSMEAAARPESDRFTAATKVPWMVAFEHVTADAGSDMTANAIVATIASTVSCMI